MSQKQIKDALITLYQGRFDKVKDSKTYWNSMSKNSLTNQISPILGIWKDNGEIEAIFILYC